jgi:hypothetical protein
VTEFVLAHALPCQPPMTIQAQHVDARRPAHTVISSDSRFDDLMRRIKAEYLEMPGLRLSAAQAQRLWSLDARTCMSVLEVLLADRFLACTSSGAYRRFDSV